MSAVAEKLWFLCCCMLMIVPQKADIIDVDTEKATKVPREWHDFEDAPASASGRACHLDVDDTFVSRKIDKKIESREQGEGMGARVRRSIGRPELQNFDPFLMLDEFKVGPGAGFPDHPHRGFETVTYMLPSTKGSFEHEDFVGHRGIIGPGDLQWMTAGRGILHSEIPASKEVSHGLQLWVNLAAKDKMIDPAYQELKAQHIPHVKSGGVKAIVIAGSALGITSPVYTRTPTHYIHFIMDKNSVLKQPIPKGWNAFLYILSGQCYVGGDTSNCITNAHYTITLQSGGDGVMVQTKDETCEFVLLAGKPHNEPIQQHGPFVMNTREQIMEAFRDYQSGRNGFERAIGWKSEIGKRMLGYHDDEL